MSTTLKRDIYNKTLPRRSFTGSRFTRVIFARNLDLGMNVVLLQEAAPVTYQMTFLDNGALYIFGDFPFPSTETRFVAHKESAIIGMDLPTITTMAYRVPSEMSRDAMVEVLYELIVARYGA